MDTLAQAVRKLSEARECAATWSAAMELSLQRNQDLEAENAQLRARIAALESVVERLSEVVDEFYCLFKSLSGR